MNIAVVGTGYWGKNLVRNLYNLGALHSICDLDATSVKELSNRYPGISGTTSFPDILNNREIAGIVIATPAITHFELARDVITAGKDVYIEKPLCLSEHEGRELDALANQYKRVLMVGHLLWYHPAVLKLKDLVHKNKIGRIQYIYSNTVMSG